MKIRETLIEWKHKVKYIYARYTYSIVFIIDGIYDIWLCGSWLSRKRIVNVKGATSYEPTRYWALNIIFKDAKFTENDSFVDIGCGEGRVIAWLINKHFPGQITGIEKDPDVAAIAKKWMEHRPNENVRLIEGDAMEQFYNDYTIMYIFRPFNEEFFERLILRIEEQLTHPIRFYYLTDFYCRKYLTGRQGWKMINRQYIWRTYGLYIFPVPQFYSVWIYTPNNSDPNSYTDPTIGTIES